MRAATMSSMPSQIRAFTSIVSPSTTRTMSAATGPTMRSAPAAGAGATTRANAKAKASEAHALPACFGSIRSTRKNLFLGIISHSSIEPIGQMLRSSQPSSARARRGAMDRRTRHAPTSPLAGEVGFPRFAPSANRPWKSGRGVPRRAFDESPHDAGCVGEPATGSLPLGPPGFPKEAHRLQRQ